MTKRIEVVLYGLVQGVFFRHGVKEIAEELGLVGWVRNEPDGSVRVVAEGTRDNLQKLVEWCKKGTDTARVLKVDVQWKEATREFEKFYIM